MNQPKIDWEAYFTNFLKTHGEPVPRRDENGEIVDLVFKDGWRHKANTFEWGEIPPPKDETRLQALKDYWTKIKSESLRKQIEEQEKYIQKMQNISSTLGHPLLVKSDSQQEAEPINYDIHYSKIKILTEQLTLL